MIQLPSGCYYTELKVNPKNWKTNRNAIRKNWFIYYRVYDPKDLKHNIYIIHELSADELNLLQTKKIDYFKVSGFKISPDRWQKEKLIKMFEEIVSKN